MAQPDHDPDRHKSRRRKERIPAQLAVLAQAREKAKIVIAERAKIDALQKTAVVRVRKLIDNYFLFLK